MQMCLYTSCWACSHWLSASHKAKKQIYIQRTHWAGCFRVCILWTHRIYNWAVDCAVRSMSNGRVRWLNLEARTQMSMSVCALLSVGVFEWFLMNCVHSAARNFPNQHRIAFECTADDAIQKSSNSWFSFCMRFVCTHAAVSVIRLKKTGEIELRLVCHWHIRVRMYARSAHIRANANNPNTPQLCFTAERPAAINDR